MKSHKITMKSHETTIKHLLIMGIRRTCRGGAGLASSDRADPWMFHIYVISRVYIYIEGMHIIHIMYIYIYMCV